ncbi:MAG TPA: hypothetical protein V6C97_15685 [Oculatellaceae cyanobacterium]
MNTVQYIGEAWLDDDGSITLHLFCTSDGAPAQAMLTYKTTDEQYESILEHLGGLNPGEKKPVRPFPD